MLTRHMRTVAWIAVVWFLVLQAHSQIVRIEFTSVVTAVGGADLASVTVGSSITGRVEVVLPLLPADSEPHPGIGQHTYVEQGHPGYTFQFGTGFENFTFDSANAATDAGTTPGVFMFDEVGSYDYLGFQARNQGSPFGAILSFEVYDEPRTLLSSDYFPEAVNLPAGMERAKFQYYNNFGTSSVIARVTSASITIDTEGVITGLLAYRVNASGLPAKKKRQLLATLNDAERAFSNDRCRLGLTHLRRFKNQLRAKVARKDAGLAAVLRAGAQQIIDAGCPR